MITNINQLDLSKRYTYADYLTWQFDEMVELIRGKVFRVPPAPSRRHQEVSMKLQNSIFNAIKENPCRVYTALFDVKLRLADESDFSTVVQPDICVICDLEKLTPQGCTGAPDWVIEILSPSTSSKDLNEKFDLYQHAGVREYWIVQPQDYTAQIYFLNESGAYESIRQRLFSETDVVHSVVFPEVEIDLGYIFKE